MKKILALSFVFSICIIACKKEITKEDRMKDVAVNYIKGNIHKYNLRKDTFTLKSFEFNDMDTEYLIRCEFSTQDMNGDLKKSVMTIPVTKETEKVDLKTYGEPKILFL